MKISKQISNLLLCVSSVVSLHSVSFLPAIANPSLPSIVQSTEPAETSSPEQTTYSIFMLVKTTNEWLQLSPTDRFAFLETDISPILERHSDVTMRFFDTEGFNSRVTDVIIWESSSLDSYQGVVEALRESDFWGTYFEVVEILPGLENAYASYYGVDPF